MNPSVTKKRFSPSEISWVQANYSQLDHILFFNYFVRYNKSRAIRRFKAIVEHYVPNPQQKEFLLSNFQKWNQSKESKIFWKNRTENETFAAASSISSIMAITETASSVVTDRAEEMKQFFDENIRLPEVSQRYFVKNIDVSLLLNNHQKQAYSIANTTALSFKSNFTEMLSFSSILLLENNPSCKSLLASFGCENLHDIIKQINNTTSAEVTIGSPSKNYCWL